LVPCLFPLFFNAAVDEFRNRGIVFASRDDLPHEVRYPSSLSFPLASTRFLQSVYKSLFLCRLIKLVWHISNCRYLISSLDLLQGTRRAPLLPPVVTDCTEVGLFASFLWTVVHLHQAFAGPFRSYFSASSLEKLREIRIPSWSDFFLVFSSSCS